MIYQEHTHDTSGTPLSIHQEQIIDTSRTIHRSNMLIIQTSNATDDTLNLLRIQFNPLTALSSLTILGN